MIKKIIKAVNVVFGNFVRVQSRLSFDEARKYLQEIESKTKRNLLYKINLLFNMITYYYSNIMQKIYKDI